MEYLIFATLARSILFNYSDKLISMQADYFRNWQLLVAVLDFVLFKQTLNYPFHNRLSSSVPFHHSLSTVLLQTPESRENYGAISSISPITFTPPIIVLVSILIVIAYSMYLYIG